MNLFELRRYGVALVCTTLLSACGTGAGNWVDIVSHVITPNPVTAPAAGSPTALTITKTIDAWPDYQNSGILIAPLNASDAQFATPLASFLLMCGSAKCSSATTSTACTVSIGSSATKRLIRCDGNTQTVELDAGRYAYRLTANTQPGTFFGTEYDYVDGVIEFR